MLKGAGDEPRADVRQQINVMARAATVTESIRLA